MNPAWKTSIEKTHKYKILHQSNISAAPAHHT